MPGPMGSRPGRTTEKAKDFKGTTKKLINNYLSKYKIGLIIVLEEGKIVGKGTHEELMKNCETYKQIALSQLSEEELNNSKKEVE